jgi:translation initiation factor 4E
MASGSTLPGPALNAARAALNSALNDKDTDSSSPSPEPVSSQETAPLSVDTNGAHGADPDEEEPEEGEIQELDLAAHAEDIRTVFSDPTNFNVKVRLTLDVGF